MIRLCKNFFFLFRTSAPLRVYEMYFYTLVKTILSRKEFKKRREEFGSKPSLLGSFSKDFVTGNVPYWLMIFFVCGMQDKEIEALEMACCRFG
jgi:hypothetical protein